MDVPNIIPISIDLILFGVILDNNFPTRLSLKSQNLIIIEIHQAIAEVNYDRQLQHPENMQNHRDSYSGIEVEVQEFPFLKTQFHSILLSVIELDGVDHKSDHADEPEP